MKLMFGLLERLTAKLALAVAGSNRSRVRAMRLAERASGAAERDDWDEAISFAKLAVAADPNWPEGHLLLGYAYERKDRPLAAQQTYESGLGLAPEDYRLSEALGNLQMAGENFSAAETAYRHALELRPKNAELLRKLAIAVARQDRLDEADRTLRQAIDRDPENAQVLAALGTILQWKRDWQAAISFYTAALERHPGLIKTRYELARCLVESGRWHESLQHMREVVKVRPEAREYQRFLEAIESHLGRDQQRTDSNAD
jgi:Flp pilus assembly protein TadD